MPARKPEECDMLVTEAIISGDLEAAVALYEPDAAFVVDGNVVTGTDAIREVMTGFIAMKPTIKFDGIAVYQSGDIALTVASYNMTGTGPDGSPINASGKSAEVVRRQPDGTWRFIIDCPAP